MRQRRDGNNLQRVMAYWMEMLGKAPQSSVNERTEGRISGLVLRSSDSLASHTSCLPLIPMAVISRQSSALQAGSRVRHTREHAAMLVKSPSRKSIVYSIVSIGKGGDIFENLRA